MNKLKFIEVTGEDPEDMFGPDWENELLALSEDFGKDYIFEDFSKYDIEDSPYIIKE